MDIALSMFLMIYTVMIGFFLIDVLNIVGKKIKAQLTLWAEPKEKEDDSSLAGDGGPRNEP